MRNVFDYIYYRTAKFYYKWDRETGLTAILALTGMQALFIAEAIMIPLDLIYPMSVTRQYAKLCGYITVGIIILIGFFNFRIYYNQYGRIKSKWENEARSLIKGYLVVFILAVPWMILIFGAIIRTAVNAMRV